MKPAGKYTIVAAAALAIILAPMIWLAHSRSARPASRAALTDEGRAYLSEITVSGAHMSAAENLLGNSVVYLDATIGNKGARVVRAVDLRLEFVDVLNQLVLLETAHPVTPSGPALKPAESRPFRVTFEHMPDSWNQAVPAITPAYVSF